jgi:phospholipid/cholesterol/gamma-HCH transport system ATP-binding protein
MTPNPNTNAPAIEFRNVFLAFDDRTVLNNITFKLDRGEMIVLTGASGSGKSMLLRLAMGLMKPDAGAIFIEGREIENLKETDLLDMRSGVMGMVFQEDSLFTGLSVYDNVAYRLEEHGWSEEQIQPAVLEVLKYVGLDGEQTKLPEELSGGMKRRLEIARALVGWPRIMLFDEPTMSLDPIVAVNVLDLVIRARDINHISSLYVTKKMYEIPYLAGFRAEERENGKIVIVEASPENRPPTRVMVLDEGRIVFDGPIADFNHSTLPVIQELSTLDAHQHARDHHYNDPWSKERVPRESIL